MKNLTDVFTDTEMQLLNKGLKYNLHHKHKKWIETLAIEADTAICQLPEKDHGYMRHLVANNIQKITKKHNTLKEKHRTIYTEREHLEWSTIRNLRHKINQSQQIITKADKGNTLVILHKNVYNNNIEELITKNNFTKLPHDMTNKLQRNICNNLNKCNKVIHTNNTWKYINMNLRAPQIHGRIKLHKHDMTNSQLERKSQIQKSKTHKHIIKQNTDVATCIQHSEFTQSITIPYKHQNRQK
jgi:hypothetical protein